MTDLMNISSAQGGIEPGIPRLCGVITFLSTGHFSDVRPCCLLQFPQGCSPFSHESGTVSQIAAIVVLVVQQASVDQAADTSSPGTIADPDRTLERCLVAAQNIGLNILLFAISPVLLLHLWQSLHAPKIPPHCPQQGREGLRGQLIDIIQNGFHDGGEVLGGTNRLLVEYIKLSLNHCASVPEINAQIPIAAQHFLLLVNRRITQSVTEHKPVRLGFRKLEGPGLLDWALCGNHSGTVPEKKSDHLS